MGTQVTFGQSILGKVGETREVLKLSKLIEDLGFRF
jgi:hypothetical protein